VGIDVCRYSRNYRFRLVGEPVVKVLVDCRRGGGRKRAPTRQDQREVRQKFRMDMIICGFTAVRQEISEGNVRLLLHGDEFRLDGNMEFIRPLMRRSPSTPASAKTVTAQPAPSSSRGPRPIRLPAR